LAPDHIGRGTEGTPQRDEKPQLVECCPQGRAQRDAEGHANAMGRLSAGGPPVLVLL